MHPAATTAIAVATSALTTLLVLSLRGSGPGDPATPASAATSDGADDVTSEVRKLTARLAELEQRAETRVDDAGATRLEVSGGELDRRIQLAIERLQPSLAADVAGEASAGDAFSVDTAVAELLAAGSVNPNVNQAAWKAIRDAGKIDEVVDAFAKRAKDNPHSADAQADYGEVLLAKVQQGGDVMEQGRQAMLADAAYDKALKIDETHWRARFNKAVSYSFWPAITGKPAESMRHFETLLTQQESRPAASHEGYVQSYLLLGNMYSQQGNPDKAREVWERGLRYHPNDPQLRGQLGQ